MQRLGIGDIGRLAQSALDDLRRDQEAGPSRYGAQFSAKQQQEAKDLFLAFQFQSFQTQTLKLHQAKSMMCL